MDTQKFRQQYPLKNKGNVDVLLRQQEQWTSGAKIQFTPTIFINGYELPKQYKSYDLKKMIRGKEIVEETETNYALT